MRDRRPGAGGPAVWGGRQCGRKRLAPVATRSWDHAVWGGGAGVEVLVAVRVFANLTAGR